jgi:cell division protein FtsQ
MNRKSAKGKVALVALVVAVSAGAVWFFAGYLVTRLGFTLARIVVVGRNHTTHSQIYKAVGLKAGQSIWSQDLAVIRQQTERLNWVDKARIERRLPNTLVLYLVERRPMAIWQRDGHKVVVDFQGACVQDADPKKFPGLLVITGQEAPLYFQDLMPHLPKIKRILAENQTANAGPIGILGASFLRSQRWDLYIQFSTPNKGRLKLRLPERDLDKATARLEKFWPHLDADQVVDLDLRFEDAVLYEVRD